jgi:regulatory protein YycH of two-component signal transduction system YycFG
MNKSLNRIPENNLVNDMQTYLKSLEETNFVESYIQSDLKREIQIRKLEAIIKEANLKLSTNPNFMGGTKYIELLKQELEKLSELKNITTRTNANLLKAIKRARNSSQDIEKILIHEENSSNVEASENKPSALIQSPKQRLEVLKVSNL